MRTLSTQLAVPALLLLASVSACGEDFADPSRELAEPVATAAGGLHPVVIHRPETLGVVDTERLDVTGIPIGVACETCHGDAATPEGEALVEAQGNPEGFHGSVTVAHGEQACAACHDPEDRSRLRLADGRTLEMADAMTLCAQCHGPQHRDYRAGSHGGMSGYWDLRQGPRERNHCLDCHDAHEPAFQGGLPVPAALDRGRQPAHAVEHDADHDGASAPQGGH